MAGKDAGRLYGSGYEFLDMWVLQNMLTISQWRLHYICISRKMIISLKQLMNTLCPPNGLCMLGP